jgi:thymidine phosphorylase
VLVGRLGAGRQKPSDTIDYEVGMRLLKTVGDEIRAGEAWIEVYHNADNFDALYASDLARSIEVSQSPVATTSLIYKIVEA